MTAKSFACGHFVMIGTCVGIKFIRDIFVLGGQRIFLLLVQTLTSVLVSRTLGPEHYGALAFAMSVAGLCALPAMSGLTPLMTREAARCKIEKSWISLSAMLSKANLWIFLVSITAISIIMIYSNAHSSNEIRTHALLIGIFFVPLIAYTSLYTAILQGFGKTILAQSLECLATPIIYGTLILYLWLTENLTMIAAIASSFISILAPLLLMMFKSVKQILKISDNTLRPPDLVKNKPDLEWFKILMPFFFLKLLGSLNNYIPSIILGIETNDYLVGIYKISESISMMTSLPLILVGMLIGPRFVALYAKKDLVEIERLAQFSARLAFMLALLFALIMFFFGGSLLELLYGKSYSQSYNALIILAVGQLINVGCGSVALILNMTGHERETLRTFLFSALVNIVLSLVLVPIWQEIGAAVASAVSLSLWNLGLIGLVRKRLAIRIAIF